MSDRELLELAAKASGMRYIKPLSTYGGQLGLVLCDEHERPGRDWRPMDDDGDALRLAVKLDIDISFNWEIAQCIYAGEEMETMERNDGDKRAATCRAIVRAAAEIGRAKP